MGTFSNLSFWERLKEIISKIIRWATVLVRQFSLEVNYFWTLPSTPKISEPFELFISLLSFVICDAELKHEISYMLVLFDVVILLELRCMVDPMTADDWFYKLEIEYLIFSEQYWITPFLEALKCWSSQYVARWDFSVTEYHLLICMPFSQVPEPKP